MIRIGEYNRLTIARTSDHGLFLTDGEQDVLLPRKYSPEGMAEGDSLRVFVLTDSEDRPIATTLRPKGVVGDFTPLRAKEVTRVGAFMDWGLDKDLLVPFGEQQKPIEEGKVYVVRISLDEKSGRVIGSTRIARFLLGDSNDLLVGQEVSLLIVDVFPEGARAIIDGKYSGMIFPDEIHERIKVGDSVRGFVKRVREDGAVALSLTPSGYQGALDESSKILSRLRREGGFLPFGDRSSPEEIRREFGISKATFKKALGSLMKSGQIEQTQHGIRESRK